MNRHSFERREVLHTLAAATASVVAGCTRKKTPGGDANQQPAANGSEKAQPGGSHGADSRDRLGALLPKRRLGPSGPEVSMLGVGGHHLVRVKEKQAHAILEACIEHGIRFFDTAKMYGDGESETRFGKYLVPKYRDVSFIMSKSHAPTGKEMLVHLDDSLRRMGCDYIDLWQVHALESEEDVDKRVKAGVLDALEQATRSGKVKHLGITGHSSYRAHLAMLGHLKKRGITVHAAQMPVNVVDPHYDSFITNVVPRCIDQGIGVLAMKTLAYGRLLGNTAGWARKDAELKKLVPELMPLEDALGFVWSLPTSVLISGMTSPAQVKENAAIARRTAAFTEAKRSQLVQAVEAYGGQDVEFYKV